MYKRWCHWALGVVCGLLGIMVIVEPVFAQDRQPHPVRLKVQTLIPDLAADSGTLPADHVAQAQQADDYYIVQFSGPIEPSWKDEVTALGAHLLHYIPDYAFKVRMTRAQAVQVRKLSNVVWIERFKPEYKLDPDLKRNGTRIYKVNTSARPT